MNEADLTVIYVDKSPVSCDGSHQELGHPLIYMDVGPSPVACPYCSQKFCLKALK